MVDIKSKDGLSKLKEGDLFEAGALLPGLDSKEPICWKVLERWAGRLTLHAYYFDVFLFSCSVDTQSGIWSFA